MAEGVAPAAVEAGRAWRRALAVAALVVAAGLWVFGLVLAALNGNTQSAAPGVGPVALAVVGALIVWQRPHNRLGWVFISAAVAGTVLGAGSQYANRALVHAPGSLPGGGFVGWLADFMAHPVIGLLAGILPQLFPTGRPLSSRWRWPVWAAIGFMVFGSVGNGFAPQHLESVPSQPNPYAIGSARGLFGALIVASVICGLVAAAGSAASLIVRWRRARGDERQQLKWFLAGVVLLPIPIALHGVSNTVSDAGVSVLFVVIPATVGVAILRYRLYDLDLVVRRAIVYLLVSALVPGDTSPLSRWPRPPCPARSGSACTSWPRWSPRPGSSRCAAGCSAVSTGSSTATGPVPTTWWPGSVATSKRCCSPKPCCPGWSTRWPTLFACPMSPSSLPTARAGHPQPNTASSTTTPTVSR